jgi:hypothetical protein
MTTAHNTTQRTFVAAPTAGPEDCGWRFVEQPQSLVRRRPSLSWRLRH